MRRFSIQIMIVVLLSLLAGLAHASVISYSGVLDFDFATNGTLNLQQFDTGTYGPLQAVTFYVAHSGGATFSLDNDSGFPITAYADMERAWTITDVGLNANTTHSTITPDQILSADNGDGTAVVDYSGPDGYVWSNVAFNDPADAYTVNPVDFASYEGLGTTAFNANVTNFQNLIGFVGQPPNQQSSTYANLPPAGLRLNVTVEYTYGDQVPEPCTLALLGLGLFGMGVRARRKKSLAAA